MKHEPIYTIYLVLLTALSGIAAFILSPLAILKSASLANENPWMVLVVILVSLSAGTWIMLKLMQRKFRHEWIDALMIYALTHAIVMTKDLFFEWPNYMNALLYLAIFVTAYWLVLQPMQNKLTHALWAGHIWNVFVMVAFVGISITLALLLPVWMSLLLLVAAAIYDYWAVHKTKHMVSLAKYCMKRRLFPGFIIYKPGEKRFAVLGGGDIFFIAFITASLQKVSPVLAIGGMVGMLVGLIGLFIASERKKFYPAIPPIAAGLFAGMSVTILLSMIGVL